MRLTSTLPRLVVIFRVMELKDNQGKVQMSKLTKNPECNYIPDFSGLDRATEVSAVNVLRIFGWIRDLNSVFTSDLVNSNVARLIIRMFLSISSILGSGCKSKIVL